MNVGLPCKQRVQLRSGSRQRITPLSERGFEEGAVLRLNFRWNSRQRRLDHVIGEPSHQASRR